MKNLGFILVLMKLGGKIGPALLKLLKGAKVTKGALAVGSMGAYSYLFTWEFAIILLTAIVVHEYGHIKGMKMCGIATKGIYLIPFFGGAAVPSESFQSYKKESIVSIMGPLYGIISIFPFALLFYYTNDPKWAGICSIIALINLFNLLPINPLDGGRIIKSIAFSLNTKFGFLIVFLGFIFAFFLIAYLKIYLLLIILFIGMIEIGADFYYYRKNNFQYLEYELMNKKEIIQQAFIYIGVIVLFISIIFNYSNVEGADLALKILQDK